MTDMEILNALLESIGIGVRPRLFLVDYTDMSGNDYNKQLSMMDNGVGVSNTDIITMAKRELGSQGFEVTAIHEILDIQGYERLKTQLHQIPDNVTLPQSIVSEAGKYIRPLYLLF